MTRHGFSIKKELVSQMYAIAGDIGNIKQFGARMISYVEERTYLYGVGRKEARKIMNTDGHMRT